MTTNLHDNEWRDANLATLHEWHPTLQDFAPDLEAIVTLYRDFAERYRDYLLQTASEPREALYGHAMDEMALHLYDRLDRATEVVWGVSHAQSPSAAPEVSQ